MKKFYSFVVSAIMGVLGFSASAEDVSFTLAINDASCLYATYYDSATGNECEYTDFVDGANEKAIPSGTYLSFYLNNRDYFFRSVNASDSQGNEIYIYFNSYSFGVYLDEQWQGAKLIIEVANYSEVRTASFSLFCDKPDNIDLTSKDNYPTLLNEEEQQIWFDPENETEWRLSSKTDRPFYSVQINDIEQEPSEYSYSTYNLTLKDGDVLNVVCTFPENPIPVHFEFPNGATEAVYVYVDDVPVNDLAYVHDDFTVNQGSVLSVVANTDDYENIMASVNGGKMDRFWGFQQVIMEETTIAITADKKATYMLTVDVADPSAIIFEKNNKVLDLVAGENYITMTEGSSISTRPVEGYVITKFKATVHGEEVYSYSSTTQANFPFNTEYGNDCILSIGTSTIEDAFSETCTVNLKGSAKSAYFICSDIENTLEEGDNTIHFAEENHGWILRIDPEPYKVLWNGAEVKHQWEGQYSPEGMLANGDVIEIIMVNNEPAENGIVTITCLDEKVKELVYFVDYTLNRNSTDPENPEETIKVENWEEPFEVPGGAWFVLSMNIWEPDYIIEAKVNGEDFDIMDNGGYISRYIDGNLDIELSTRTIEKVEYTINVNIAEGVSICDWSDWSYLELVDGENVLEANEGTTLEIRPSDPQYTIVSITDANGQEIPEDEYYGDWMVTVSAGMVLNIEVSKEEYESSAILYVGPMTRFGMNYGDFGYLNFEFNYNPEGVYETYEFNGDEVPVVIQGLEGLCAYYNNEPLENVLAEGEGQFRANALAANNSVIKVFASEPFMAEVTIADAESEITSVVTDLVVEQTASEFEALEGTLIAIAVKDGAKVKCNDEEMAVADGVCKITVNAEAMSIVVSSESGIESIAADRLNGKVYNMQGIEIKKGNLTPGLYIVNGKKTYVK